MEMFFVYFGNINANHNFINRDCRASDSGRHHWRNKFGYNWSWRCCRTAGGSNSFSIRCCWWRAMGRCGDGRASAVASEVGHDGVGSMGHDDGQAAVAVERFVHWRPSSRDKGEGQPIVKIKIYYSNSIFRNLNGNLTNGKKRRTGDMLKRWSVGFCWPLTLGPVLL